MAKDKVVLVYVQDYGCVSSEGHVPEDCNIPLGILYLGSYLADHGITPVLLDTRLEREDEFIGRLERELGDACLAGFSVTTPNVREALRLSRYVKEKAPGLAVVWGGAHPSLFPDSTIANPNIDYLITGYGEQGLLELSRYLSGAGISLGGIPNLVFKDPGSPTGGSAAAADHQATQVNVCYDLLPLERYCLRKAEDGRLRRQMEVLSSRGCPYRCSFCINSVLGATGWQPYPLEAVLENIDHLIKSCRIEHFFFMDEEFFCDRERAKLMVSMLSSRRISWEANCRADYIRYGFLDKDVLSKFKESGCMRLRFGLESGSQRILDELNKGITVKQSLAAVKAVSASGIQPSASFMMAVPGETRRDILKTLGLILELHMIDPNLHLIGPLIFRPYPGSALFKKCVSSGLDEPASLQDWSDFYIHNSLDEYSGGLPWFRDKRIFDKVWCFCASLRYMKIPYLFRVALYWALKLHLACGLRFTAIIYYIFRLFRRPGRGAALTSCRTDN